MRVTTEPSATDDEQQQQEPEEFLNRAARRAKGKKHGHVDAKAAAGQPHAHPGAVPNRRAYGNRRTGG